MNNKNSKTLLNLPFGYQLKNNFSKKKPDLFNNGNSKPSYNFFNKIQSLRNIDYDIKNILWILLFLVIILIVSYLVAFTIKYFTVSCKHKRRYGSYIFRFRWNDVCICEQDCYQEEKVDLSKVSYMNEIPTSEDPSVIETDLQKLEGKPQVFHIANQDYTYDQAQCKCASYNATLASYADLVEAYNKGANWCSYGWSKGQNAYYPTQKCKWEKLQSTDKKNDCGKPGINGGFFGDPYLKFGVNCFGKKPEGKIVRLEEKKCPEKSYCELPQNYFASHRLKTDEISPFNEDKWNEYDKN